MDATKSDAVVRVNFEWADQGEKLAKKYAMESSDDQDEQDSIVHHLQHAYIGFMIELITAKHVKAYRALVCKVNPDMNAKLKRIEENEESEATAVRNILARAGYDIENMERQFTSQ